MRHPDNWRRTEEDSRRRRSPEPGWRREDEDDGDWRPRGHRGHQRGGGFRFPGPGPHRPGSWPGEPRMRGRARRGDVRAVVLALLAEGPRNGYQMIREIAERSAGVWRPSPGSVYPALQQLEDEGLIQAGADDSGRRAFQLTDEGREYVQAHQDELRAPWDQMAGAAGLTDMRDLLQQVGMAGYQVLSAGSDGQVRQARKILTETRKSLYRILAADDNEEETGSADSAAQTGPAGGTPTA
jgi:DNA-binding PadR family transcriptional regulator